MMTTFYDDGSPFFFAFYVVGYGVLFFIQRTFSIMGGLLLIRRSSSFFI